MLIYGPAGILGIVGAVWIVVVACPANFLELTTTKGLRLDQDQRFPATPNFWQPPSVFTPASWQNAGGEILRQIFGVPILAGPSWGVIQTAL
jgi:hypothetical protein